MTKDTREEMADLFSSGADPETIENYIITSVEGK